MADPKDLRKALGISENAARLYWALLEIGPATISQIAARAGISRTVITRPLNELLDLGFFTRRPHQKRLFYYPLPPSEWTKVIEKRRHLAEELSQTFVSQFLSPHADLQLLWYSGLDGIYQVVRDFFSQGQNDVCRSFENADAITYLGPRFVDSVVKQRLVSKTFNRVILIGEKDEHQWYISHLRRNKEELRDVIIISPTEYPFRANVATLGNLVLILEYSKKPFALLVDNDVLAQSVRSLHDLVWDRYRMQH